jgi:hypothetical protein
MRIRIVTEGRRATEVPAVIAQTAPDRYFSARPPPNFDSEITPPWPSNIFSRCKA